MSQDQILGIDQVTDAQRSSSRAFTEQIGTTSPVAQVHRVDPAPQAAEQIAGLHRADTVQMSEEARQALHGRSEPDTPEVTALKEALRGMMHERTPTQEATRGGGEQPQAVEAPPPTPAGTASAGAAPASSQQSPQVESTTDRRQRLMQRLLSQAWD